MMSQEIKKYQLIVIGAGPAGLMAAGQAAALGIHTLLLEKMPQAGMKLRISGKGRCNLSNTADLRDFINHFGREGRFLHQTFARFFRQDLLDFLKVIGVETQTERGGRIFPTSEDADDVTERLTRWARDQGVEIHTQTVVQSIACENARVSGVMCESGQRIPARTVILASGGASFSHTGSSGDGYRMAAELGHTIVPLRPALVPIKTKGDICKRLQGLSLRNVKARVMLDGKNAFSDFGEMLFTHFGLSGPIILTMSGQIVDALRARKSVEISIDLKPALDEEKLNARLLRDIDAHGKQHFSSLLKDLLPQKMIAVIADLSGIPLDKACHQITADERTRLLALLKDFRLEVSGHLPLDAAMVTAGGVSLKEVDARSMQSKLVSGLYFAGEVLDLAADTGGFNLQAAFSTGWLAGTTAAEALASD